MHNIISTSRWVALVALMSAVSGCKTSEVDMDLRFAGGQEPLLFSNTVRVFALDADEISCADAIGQQDPGGGTVGRTPDYWEERALTDTGLVPTCDLFEESSAAILSDLPNRRLSLFAITYDSDNLSSLNIGCSTANPHFTGAGDKVTIQLRPTSYFQAVYGGRPHPCISQEELCSGACM